VRYLWGERRYGLGWEFLTLGGVAVKYCYPGLTYCYPRVPARLLMVAALTVPT
jgi:hypothetical protein